MQDQLHSAEGLLRSFSPDGQRVYVGSATGLIGYDLNNPAQPIRFGVAPAATFKMLFAPTGDRLALTTQWGEIRICDAMGRPLSAVWQPLHCADEPGLNNGPQPAEIRDIAWHPDGRYLAVSYRKTTGNREHMVTVFDTRDGKRVASCVCNQNAPWIQFNPIYPSQLCLTSVDEVTIWKWKAEARPTPAEGSLGKLVPSPNGKLFLAPMAGRAPQNALGVPTLLSVDLKSQTIFKQADLQGGDYYSIQFAWMPDSQHFVASTNPISIRKPNGDLLELVPALKGVDTRQPEFLDVSPDNTQLLVRMESHYVLLDLLNKKLEKLEGISATQLKFSPNGDHLIGATNNTLTYWNKRTREMEQLVQLLPENQYAIFSPAGELLTASPEALKHLTVLAEDNEGRLLLKPLASLKK